MIIQDSKGRTVPFFIDWFTYESIATADYSPTEDPSFDTQLNGVIEDRGFLVRPDADGLLYGITLYAFKANNDSVSGLVPEAYLGVDNQWIECRFVKVFATNDSSYGTIAENINVGFTL